MDRWQFAVLVVIGGGAIWMLNAIRLQLNAIRVILLHPEVVDEVRNEPL